MTDFDIENIRKEIEKILCPIKSFDEKTKASKDFLFKAHRSIHSNKIPDYYLVYFLFSDLLKYQNVGRFEKVAWSFPIDYNGKAFLIEYRKFGVGIFIQDKDTDEDEANNIVKLINRAVKKANSFFDYIADKAIKGSELNVNNNNGELFSRYNFYNKMYKLKYKKFKENEGKFKVKSGKTKFGEYKYSISLSYKYKQHSNFLAISCIEAFYSWTEHLFVHLAIIANGMWNGEEVANLIESEWKIKYQKAITIKDKRFDRFYNELLSVRQQLRNFVAHGAFGKNGNAFKFHSDTGAVPVLMRYKKTSNRFSLIGSLSFNDEEVIKLIEEFIEYLWNSPLKPAMHYTQTRELPSILTFAKNGIYTNAMESVGKMKSFANDLAERFDNAANMDW